MSIVIKSTTGEVLAETGEVDLSAALTKLVKAWVNLGGADLRGADLSGANLRGANLRGVNLRDANLSGADLSGADLDWANLGDADLRGADLDGVNLSGANLDWAKLSGSSFGPGVPVTRTPLVIEGLKYRVMIFDRHAKIGCTMLSIEEWTGMGDIEIRRMGGEEPVQFWKDHKDLLLGIAKANGRPVEG
jgi:uncharacterized protein YjbI with pentapeptide repeats